MPTYEFHCPVCGWEIEKRMSLEQYKEWRENVYLRLCPNCDTQMKRVYEPVGFKFEGGKPSDG